MRIVADDRAKVALGENESHLVASFGNGDRLLHQVAADDVGFGAVDFSLPAVKRFAGQDGVTREIEGGLQLDFFRREIHQGQSVLIILLYFTHIAPFYQSVNGLKTGSLILL